MRIARRCHCNIIERRRSRSLAFSTSPRSPHYTSKPIDERASRKRKKRDRWWMSRAPIKRLELAAISRPAAESHPRSVSRHFRRVNFNNSTSPPSTLPTIRLRTAMTRTIFPAAFNYPRTRGSHERAQPREISIVPRSFSLSSSLLPLSAPSPSPPTSTAIVAFAGA